MTDETVQTIETIAGGVASAAVAFFIPPAGVASIITMAAKYGPEVAIKIVSLFKPEGATPAEIIAALTVPSYDSFGIKDVAQRTLSDRK